SQATREADEDQRAHDGVRHAAAWLAHGLRRVGEELEVDRGASLVEEEGEDEDQGQDDEGRRRPAQDAHDPIHQEAPGRHAHSRTPVTAPPTVQTSSRANALTSTVTTRRRRPISTRAER